MRRQRGWWRPTSCMRSLYPVISSNKSLGEGLTYVILAHPRLRLPSFDGRTRNAGQRRKNERSARICPTRVNNTNVKRGARVFCCTTVHMDLEVHAKLYRASHVLEDLGCVDLDLGSSPGWWVATVATYCLSRMVEHPKSMSTKPSPRGHGTSCTLVADSERKILRSVSHWSDFQALSCLRQYFSFTKYAWFEMQWTPRHLFL